RRYADILPNLSFIEAGFEQMAAAANNMLPDADPFDFITVHGVYSWISPAARAAIRQIVTDRLAPGGLLYLHYTSHPGQSVFAGAQAMLRRIASLTPGDASSRLANGIACLQALD